VHGHQHDQVVAIVHACTRTCRSKFVRVHVPSLPVHVSSCVLSCSASLRDLQQEFKMHEMLREERFYVREALAMLGHTMIMKHGGAHTLNTFMQQKASRKQIQQHLRRAAFEVFSCIHALHKHQIVHRVRIVTCTCCPCATARMTHTVAARVHVAERSR
jgi:hypothetical protein